MTFKITAKYQPEISKISLDSSEKSSDELTGLVKNVGNVNVAAVQPSDFFELDDFNILKIDPGTEERIKRQNISDLLQQGSGIIGSAEDSLLGKLGFDADINGSNAKIRDFTDGFGLSGTTDLLGLAAKVGGQARSGEGDEKWVQDGDQQESSAGSHTVTRTRETNKNDKEGNHTRTTYAVIENDENTGEVSLTTTQEEYDEGEANSDGTRTYSVRQTRDNHAEKTTEVYEEAGTINKDGTRTPVFQKGSRSGPDGQQQVVENPKPIVPIGKINPNPEDDGAYGGGNYDIDHPALNRHKHNHLKHFDPSIDFGDEYYSTGPYTGPCMASFSGSDGGTSTGVWDPQGGVYLGPSLSSLSDSMGGVSTGTDWL